MNILVRLTLLSGLLFSALFSTPILIQRVTLQSPTPAAETSVFLNPSHTETAAASAVPVAKPALLSTAPDDIKIALISSPSVIGKYTQSTYNVALATLLSKHLTNAALTKIDIPNESEASLAKALAALRNEGYNAIIAPLTLAGAQRLSLLEKNIQIFIPTVHKRDVPDAPDNFVFGSIDYIRQIEALVPHMSNGIAIFYDDSAVGTQLKKSTETLFLKDGNGKKSVSSYRVDAKGDNIIAHLSRPSAFSKKSIILHIPVVKSSILTAHMTFTGIRERNILSTQINVDPSLLNLTQYNDRKNMILANSIVEQADSIYETNVIMNNDISFDWINYATSIGIDYLIAEITGTDREYSMRISDAQVLYPVELLKAQEFGFESLAAD